jgi:TonB family protein
LRVKSQSLVLTALIMLAPGAAWARSGELAPPVVVREGQPRPPALTAAPRPSLITNPRWSERPQLVYPEPALAANVEGAVTMTCTVSRTGHLVDCEIVSDSTPGFGFAEAALSAAASARVEPRTVDGLAEDAKATWTARFRLPEAAARPPVPPTGGALYDADGKVVDALPQWARRPLPTARDLPPRLLRMRGPVNAAAIVACRAEVDGRLSDCRAESESPAGAGVGAAAVGIARRGRLAAPIAPDVSGQQPTVRTTITFHIP